MSKNEVFVYSSLILSLAPTPCSSLLDPSEGEDRGLGIRDAAERRQPRVGGGEFLLRRPCGGGSVSGPCFPVTGFGINSFLCESAA